MTPSMKRSVARWLHIVVGSVIATYIYSPWGQIPTFQLATKFIIIPASILSGLWLWKGYLLRKYRTGAKATTVLLLLGLLSLYAFVVPLDQKITLKITNIEKAGKIYVSFCTDAKQWSANGQYRFQFENPAKGTNQYAIPALPEGVYAIAIFQDLNGNGRLDNNMFGVPKEPFAFSNNVKPKLSAPSFSDCAFELKGSNPVITITLLN
jgi:uncharacterized protein (DUF2141 family)